MSAVTTRPSRVEATSATPQASSARVGRSLSRPAPSTAAGTNSSPISPSSTRAIGASPRRTATATAVARRSVSASAAVSSAKPATAPGRRCCIRPASWPSAVKSASASAPASNGTGRAAVAVAGAIAGPTAPGTISPPSASRSAAGERAVRSGSTKTRDRMRHVGLLERGEVLAVEGDVEGGDRVVEMVRLRCADDRRRDTRP